MNERDIINELRATRGYAIKDNTVEYSEAERLIRNVIDILKTRGIIPVVVESKSNEKAALNEAITAIYFNDNSDYLSGLYGVVRSLTGLDEPTEEGIKQLFKELNPE